MRRPGAALSLALVLLFLLRASDILACPACAPSGGAGSDGGGIWSIVGIFLLVPPLIATAIILLMRREYRMLNAESASTASQLAS